MTEPAPWELPGWSALAAGDPYARDGSFPIAAYSEYMPGPFVGIKPSGADDPWTRPPGDEHGWRIPDHDLDALTRGFGGIIEAVAATARRLQLGGRALSRDAIAGNPYTPPDLIAAGRWLASRPLLAVTCLSLSRTQDDKGRVRWTLFGASEQGPAAAFWCSFLDGPARWRSDGPAQLHDHLRWLMPALVPLLDSDQEPIAALAAAGVRVLPIGAVPEQPAWAREPLPPWLGPLVQDDRDGLRAVKAIVTFRAFDRLPPAIRAAYLTGALELVPSPHSLVFFGHPGYHRLARELPFATQIPLLRAVPAQHVSLRGVRVPQSGWLDERGDQRPAPLRRGHGPIVDRIKRTHRWNRARRDEDERERLDWDDKVSEALFSTAPAHLELYDKPMARNAQIWSEDYRLLLDGPHASRVRLDEAARALTGGGRFGYRFQWPPMRVRSHDVYWQQPLHCRLEPGEERPSYANLRPSGWLVAYEGDRPAAAFWPRSDRESVHTFVAIAFDGEEHRERRRDLRRLLQVRDALDGTMDRDLAACLVSAKLAARSSIDAWLAALPAVRKDGLADEATASIRASLSDVDPGPSITFAETATRETEVRYWDTIATLATGGWETKNNADPAEGGPDPIGHGHGHRGVEVRDLDRLATWLAEQHAAAIARHGMSGRAVVGEHRFAWTTDFDLPWMHGWARSQHGEPVERNVIAVIPGRDRTRAVILADHYDTAYCEDVYDGRVGGPEHAGTRRAAAGADDNHSATAALLVAADILLPLAAKGELAHDVWLVHLTGEEFPGDCLGARHLVQRLIERNLVLELHGGGRQDLSGVSLAGAFVMDMIAHNLERDPYVFQISPGEGAASIRLAALARRVTSRWNRATSTWNAAPDRRDAPRYQRRAEGTVAPALAAHPVMHGEVRLPWQWSSTVFNTDAQIFSDAGLPVVLLMEHYDIDRRGYHDTLDTMANIDLDYGAALMAIAIETVVEVARGVIDEPHRHRGG